MRVSVVFLVLGVIACFMLVPSVARADVVIQIASADGTGWDEGPNGTWGDDGDSLDLSSYLTASDQTGIGGTFERRAAIEFDLTTLPSRTLISATLHVQASGYSPSPEVPILRIYAYEGDGSIGYGDMTQTTGALVGRFDFDDYSSGTAWRNAVNAIDITSELSSLLDDGASYAGFLLMVEQSLVGFRSIESAPSDEFAPQIVLVFEDGSPPTADAGDDQTVECTSPAGAQVTLDASGSSDPDGEDLTFAWSVPAGSGVTITDPTAETTTATFPIGTTLVTLTVTDESGEEDFDDVLITVEDDTPPVAMCITDRIALWPPRHDMVPVEVRLLASDTCSAPEDLTVSCVVASNEPDDALGDGAFTGDVDGDDGYSDAVSVTLVWDAAEEAWIGTVNLRAERDGTAGGRVYTITCGAIDDAGNETTTECVVIVPHHGG